MSEFTAPGLTAPAPGLDHDPDAPADPDLSVGVETSDLEDLAAELADVASDPGTLEVPNRPGWAIVCRTDFTGKDLDKWRKAARDRRFVEGIDGVKFSALILGATCTQVLRHGAPVTSQGDPVSLSSPAFMGTMGTRDVDTTVRRLFGNEGHVDGAARRLLNEAGWGEEVYVVDPTS